MIEKFLPVLGIMKMIACLVIFAASFAAGMTMMEWRKNAEIAQIKTDIANEKAMLADAALIDFQESTKGINEAAAGFHVNVANLGMKIDEINKTFKNAKPLPVDCHIDDFRMRNISAAVEAVNKTIAGHKPVSAVQESSGP
jgi:hypothetical protein